MLVARPKLRKALLRESFKTLDGVSQILSNNNYLVLSSLNTTSVINPFAELSNVPTLYSRDPK